MGAHRNSHTGVFGWFGDRQAMASNLAVDHLKLPRLAVGRYLSGPGAFECGALSQHWDLFNRTGICFIFNLNKSGKSGFDRTGAAG